VIFQRGCPTLNNSKIRIPLMSVPSIREIG
jgi:hypothetical protein